MFLLDLVSAKWVLKLWKSWDESGVLGYAGKFHKQEARLRLCHYTSILEGPMDIESVLLSRYDGYFCL